jgi:hypothetical protein
MHYDPTKIEEETIEINGKKIPLFKIPAGMSGPNAHKLYENTNGEELQNDTEEEIEFSPQKTSCYDEDNVFIESNNTFIDL